jgi:hypothetical protein
MPATAAIDNETLDHLLSVVDDDSQCKVRRSIFKVEFAWEGEPPRRAEIDRWPPLIR